MLAPAAFPSLSPAPGRALALAALRRVLARKAGWREQSDSPLPFGLAALDSHLPNGGLSCRALHEIVPATAAAFGFAAAVMARFSHQLKQKQVVFIIPSYALRQCGRLYGHGLSSLGFDPSRAILVTTAHRQDTIWATVEALRSQAPQAVVAMIDRLDLKASQKLHLAADDAALPLFLLRSLQTLESSAAATRWRVSAAGAVRDRFGSHGRARWRLQLERCRNGRPGEWVVEYDHVAHCFSLVAELADLSLSRSAGERCRR